MKRTFTISIILSLCLTVFGQHRTATVSTSVNADTIMIGDQVNFMVDIEKDLTQEIGLPQFEGNKLNEKLEIIGQPTVDTLSIDGRSVKLRVNYKVTAFEAGAHVLTGFPIVLMKQGSQEGGDTIRSASVDYLFVKTFEIDTTKQEIYDIKDPIHTPFILDELWDFIGRHKWAFLAGAFVALLIAVGIYYWLKNRGRQAAMARPALPPHIVAAIALEELRNKKLWQSGKHREYYSELSDIVREYINGRYGIGAMEMTSHEIISALKEVCDERPLRNIGEFFSLADLVKFAKMTPEPLENEESFATVYNFVEDTKVLIAATENTEEEVK